MWLNNSLEQLLQLDRKGHTQTAVKMKSVYVKTKKKRRRREKKNLPRRYVVLYVHFRFVFSSFVSFVFYSTFFSYCVCVCVTISFNTFQLKYHQYSIESHSKYVFSLLCAIHSHCTHTHTHKRTNKLYNSNECTSSICCTFFENFTSIAIFCITDMYFIRTHDVNITEGQFFF